MSFIPHTSEDIAAMLQAIGAQSIDELFDEIPPALKSGGLDAVPPALSEMEIARLMRERAHADGFYLNFIGAGAYEHHIPAAVWQIATRGEFYSAYTPYQAEASQGTLQLTYEYQSMMTRLTAMDVTNASLYDGASALAEAVLMAVRLHKSARRVLMPKTVHPAYRRTVATIVRNQGVNIVELPYGRGEGHTLPDALKTFAGEDIAALVIPQPNFFGVLEPADELVDWAHRNRALAIGVVNPTALALLKPPGEWGADGADIVCGEGQPLGVPLASGGSYFGFIACRKSMLRQMPGRIVGRTLDVDGRVGYTLTLQAREQHIRRSRATSNICTNQGLMVIAATIYMALLGPDGLARVARTCHANTLALLGKLTAIPGVERVFSGPVFHEAAVRVPLPVGGVLNALKAQGILGGFNLSRDYPELGRALLVCATETRSEEDLMLYVDHMTRIVGSQSQPAPRAMETGIST
jgi:glycine dehydrogenase subunit 1